MLPGCHRKQRKKPAAFFCVCICLHTIFFATAKISSSSCPSSTCPLQSSTRGFAELSCVVLQPTFHRTEANHYPSCGTPALLQTPKVLLNKAASTTIIGRNLLHCWGHPHAQQRVLQVSSAEIRSAGESNGFWPSGCAASRAAVPPWASPCPASISLGLQVNSVRPSLPPEARIYRNNLDTCPGRGSLPRSPPSPPVAALSTPSS